MASWREEIESAAGVRPVQLPAGGRKFLLRDPGYRLDRHRGMPWTRGGYSVLSRELVTKSKC